MTDAERGGCWSLVTVAMFTNWVETNGKVKVAANRIVTFSPGRMVTLLSRLGGAPGTSGGELR